MRASENILKLLTRTATGVIFVVVVLGAMMLGPVSYGVLLGLIFVGCVVELWRLAPKALYRWIGGFYIALCMAAMWCFPEMGEGMWGLGAGRGVWRCVFFGTWDMRIAPAFIVTVWANDVFAYLVGSTLGRHRMCPRISPNKTWEGFIAGVVGAIVAAGAMGHLWIGGSLWLWMAFGLVVALAAVAGDLAESRLKRRAGVKDSGRLFPGHGGFLDRFDAVLGAVPAAFLFFLATRPEVAAGLGRLFL